jgi:hypothetical protein
MNTKDDGGPAFPRDHTHLGHNGLSMRDYFAAKAMQSFVARWAGHSSHNAGGCFEHMAGHAYELADAMLKARQT